ncbi:MAG: aspartyl protease family protein [Kiritimatiellia bacterium]
MKRALLFVSLLLAAACRGEESVPAGPTPDGFVRRMQRDGYAAVPFRFNYYAQSVIPLHINGTEVQAMADTGADFSMATASMAERLNLAYEEKDATVHVPGETSQAARVAVATDVVANGVRLGAITNLIFPHRIEDPRDRPDVILGLDYMEQHGALIDYARQRIFLRPGGLPPQDVGPSLERGGYVRVPLRRVNKQLSVDGSVNGVPVELHLDTGTSRCYLNRSWAEEHHVPLTLSTMRVDGVAMNAADLYVAGVTNLQIGGQTVPNPEIRAFDIGQTNLIGAGFLGNLDLRLLGGILDVARSRLYVPPRPASPPPAKVSVQ